MNTDPSLVSSPGGQMKPSTYRDMHLLTEVTRSPSASQRELARCIGAALGMTNLMLRRLVKKGFIKVTGTKRSRIRYLITPKGILEKTRLTYEFLDYSLQLYGRLRFQLREQFGLLARSGHRRILLFGTNELTEIALLTLHEMGLELVGIVEEQPTRERFVGVPVRRISDVPLETYDRLVVPLVRRDEHVVKRLVASGVLEDRILAITPMAVSQSVMAEPPQPTPAAPVTEVAQEMVSST